MPDFARCVLSDKISQDTLFAGELFCYQHQSGYRFSIDSVLLSHFVQPIRDDILLDLGTGCGIIGLILLYRYPHLISALTGFELQEGLAALACENSKLNGYTGKMSVIQGDVRRISEIFQPESFSTIVCNPPFYLPENGRQNSEPEKVLARHQVACNLEEILAAATVLKNKGRFVLIYPANRVGELLAMLSAYRLTVKRMQFVYSYPENRQTARMLLLEAVKNGGEGVNVAEPLYIYQSKNGAYSEAMQKMYEPNPS